MEDFPIKKRPDFLTVICVLTFINAGYQIIDGIITAFLSDGAEDAVGELENTMDEIPGDAPAFLPSLMEGAMELTVAAAENALALGLLQILAFGIVGYGAFLMWKLQKKGFGIYIFGQAMTLIFPILLLGTNWMVLASVGVSFILVALFIGLYAANLKHME